MKAYKLKNIEIVVCGCSLNKRSLKSHLETQKHIITLNAQIPMEKKSKKLFSI